MSSPPLRVALVQQDTVWQDPAANLARAAGFVEAAARDGARVVSSRSCSPWASPWPRNPSQSRSRAPPPKHWRPSRGGSTSTSWARWWRPTPPIRGTRPSSPRRTGPWWRPTARSTPSPTGRRPALHRRHRMPVFGVDAPAPFVCYDLRFPEPFRPRGPGAADVFAPPTGPPGAPRPGPRSCPPARSKTIALSGVNRVGRDPHLEYPGRSAIHDAFGEVVASGGCRRGTGDRGH